MLRVPALEHLRGKVLDSPIRQLTWGAAEIAGDMEPYQNGVVAGHSFTSVATGGVDSFVIVKRRSTSRKLPDRVLLSPDGPPVSIAIAERCQWLRPKPLALPGVDACETEADAIRRTWEGCFSFKPEIRNGDVVTERGLRPPQIGALHAVLAHWTVTADPATIVMPTGTGKTETMLALLVAQRLERVLVIVPTDTLREQIAGKFLSLGVLKPAGVVTSGTTLPIVGMLQRRPKTIAEANEFFRRCNVIVTTAAVAGHCSDDVSERIAFLCTHLIVDEAHHVKAPTWDRVRSFFKGKPILQFTATPYRGDGKLVDGKVVYNYPLRKAQAEGYFKRINFHAIREYAADKSDERVAAAALKQLNQDVEAGHDHLLMARCSTIRRAEELYKLYGRLGSAHRPVLAHSNLAAASNRDSVRQLRARTSRVVVCVDMFGEGFDLPELKVAALHDVHKSLAVTLQFTGRFTRTNPNVGRATVVANVADIDVEEALQALYGEDPDWNHLLRELSEHATGAQVARTEFVQGFTQFPDHIPLQNRISENEHGGLRDPLQDVAP